MERPYSSEPSLGEVVLYVQNLERQGLFYRDMIGLEVLFEGDDYVDLGVVGQDQPLLRLVETDQARQNNYGLYHMALLVPSRADLGGVLKHLIQRGYPLTGGADHGYSEAIYLDDPEGNGIEIYRDRPMDDWDIRGDGRIVGVTEELDAAGLLEVAMPHETFKLPAGSVMGHVHLSVKEAQSSSQLYQKVFGLVDKFTIPSASWIAWGSYHHHLAFNQWAGAHLSKRKDKQAGLAYLTLIFSDQLYFQACLKKAELYGLTILEVEEDTCLLEDKDGIRIKMRLN